MPDIGVKLAEIEKSNLSAEEKLQQKEVLLNDYSVKADRIHTVQQLLKAYTYLIKMWNMW
jgi:preprotein translocase subunit SecA